ncbi:hypothetical protein HMPREF1141_3024 [Clostridium sp. MSTE9]|nr:hypothetical protein HMPREF1141_3024 [Clostridium sp. MSTE9]
MPQILSTNTSRAKSNFILNDREPVVYKTAGSFFIFRVRYKRILLYLTLKIFLFERGKVRRSLLVLAVI